MTHIVIIATEVRDPAALAAACRRLGLPAPGRGTARVGTGEVAGLLLRLPGWACPAVAEIASGRVQFDDDRPCGNPAEFDRLLQAYAVEKSGIEARRRGHRVAEEAQPDGSIKLTISVAGASSTIELTGGGR